MRTTLNIPDALVSTAKIRAIAEKTTLTDLLVQGLERRLALVKKSLPLPVSRATGGLVGGVSWENFSAIENGGDYYR